MTLCFAVACGADYVPAATARRALQECAHAAAEATPHHSQPTLSEPTVRRLTSDHYRVRAVLSGSGSREYLECQLKEQDGAMEILGLSVVNR
jgi:hypothetical protein